MEHFRGRYNPVKNLNLNLKRFWNKTNKSEALKETPQIRYSSVHMETMSWTDRKSKKWCTSRIKIYTTCIQVKDTNKKSWQQIKKFHNCYKFKDLAAHFSHISTEYLILIAVCKFLFLFYLYQLQDVTRNTTVGKNSF